MWKKTVNLTLFNKKEKKKNPKKKNPLKPGSWKESVQKQKRECFVKCKQQKSLEIITN